MATAKDPLINTTLFNSSNKQYRELIVSQYTATNKQRINSYRILSYELNAAGNRTEQTEVEVRPATREESIAAYTQQLKTFHDEGFKEVDSLYLFDKIRCNSFGYVAAISKLYHYNLIHIYKIVNDELIKLTVLSQGDAQLMDIKFFHHSNKLITSDCLGKICIWNLDTLQLVKTLKHGQNHSLFISKDDSMLVTNSGNWNTAFWNLVTYEKIFSDKDGCMEADFLPDNQTQYVWSGMPYGKYKTVRTRNINSGEDVDVKDFFAYSLTFAENGKYFMTWGKEHRSVYEYKTWKLLIQNFEAHLFASGINDDCIYFTKVENATQLFRYNLLSASTELFYINKKSIYRFCQVGDSKLLIGLNGIANIELVILAK